MKAPRQAMQKAWGRLMHTGGGDILGRGGEANRRGRRQKFARGQNGHIAKRRMRSDVLWKMKGKRGARAPRGPGGGLAMQKEGRGQLVYNNFCDMGQGGSRLGAAGWLAGWLASRREEHKRPETRKSAAALVPASRSRGAGMSVRIKWARSILGEDNSSPSAAARAAFLGAGAGAATAAGRGSTVAALQQLQLHLATWRHAVLPLPGGRFQGQQLGVQRAVSASCHQHTVAVGHFKRQVTGQRDVAGLKLCTRQASGDGQVVLSAKLQPVPGRHAGGQMAQQQPPREAPAAAPVQPPWPHRSCRAG